jgi:amino acid adenylation domain-containing protein
MISAEEHDPFAGGELERVVPTTEAQREVWLADSLGRDASLAYNESIRLDLDGPLDAAALDAALADLLGRHEALRATVSPDGLSLQIASEASTVLRIVDLCAEDASGRAARVAIALCEAVETPFDLADGPLFRASLLRLATERHLLVLSAHHIVCDGWSFGVIARELAQAYARARGESVAQPSPAMRFGDYAARDAERASGAGSEDDAHYWLSRFEGDVPVLDLPTDRPRPAVRGFASLREERSLDASLVTDLKRFAGRRGASLFGVLAGAFAATLGRIAGQDEVVLGVPAAGQSAAAMPALVGHCVNLLPVRIAVDPTAPATAMIADAQTALLDAFEHQEYTFGTLLRQLQVARDPGRLPLVSVMFNLDQALDGETLGFPDLRVRLASVARHFENFELFVNASQEGGALRLECQYNTGLFDAATVRHWLGAFETLLRGVLADPATAVGRLPMLDGGQQDLLRDWNDTERPYAHDLPIAQRIARQAALTPDGPAIIAGRARASHAELQARANRIAHALRARGVRRGDRVGLCVERGVDMVAGMLGILASGAAYVPLDPAFPVERLAFMAADAGLALLVTDTTAAHRMPWPAARTLELDVDAGLIATMPSQPPQGDDLSAPGRGEDPAYVIYTSGSTGQPKGVVVPQRAVGNFLESMAGTPGLGAHDRLVAVTTLSFDIAVLELLLPLTVGGTVVLASRDEVLDGVALRTLIASCNATAMQATPAGWRLLLEADWPGQAGFKALVGGEALPAGLARQLLDRGVELWNMYGPTETTVWSTCWRVERPDEGITIGRPIANTVVRVLDAGGEPAPIGAAGELCIGGDGLALGYHDRPELTADRFVPDRFSAKPGARLYRTGDRARWRADGRLEHLGRLDNQVKVRGFRIELGEVESALAAHSAVLETVASVREDRPGDVRLVAYWAPRVLPSVRPRPDAAELAAHLKRQLPDYMVPQHFLMLEAIPRLPNGKIDRRRLPAPDTESRARRAPAAPATQLQRIVLNAMGKALGLPDPELDADFFALGGHSLLAAQVVAQLNRQLGLRLTLRILFEAPTPGRLAAAIDALSPTPGDAPAAIVRRAVASLAPLSLVQERLLFLEQLQPGRTVYNAPSAHRLRGRLDERALQRAFQTVIDRHEVLRTAIVDEGDGEGPLQRVHSHLEVALFPAEDLSGIAADQREAELMRRIEARVAVPFVLSQAPLFVSRMYRLGPEEHVWLFMPHHIIWDGWSFDLFYDEMSAGYVAETDGRSSTLAALEASYGDFSTWQRQWLRSEAFTRQVSHWRARFAAAAAAPAHRLMTDRPRGAVMSGEGRTEWMRYGRPLTERLRAFGRDTDATLFMTLLAAYAVLLAGLGAMGRQMIGIPMRGRSAVETEQLMGYFTNLLPVQIEVRLDDSFRAVQDRVRTALLEAFTFPDVPIERLLQDMPELRGRGPLYQALFSFQDARRRPLDWGNLRHERLEVSQHGATEDLGLWLVEGASGFTGGLTYHADLYLPETAGRLHARFSGILEQIAERADVSVASLLALDEQEARRLRDWLAAPAAAPGVPARTDPTPAGAGTDAGGAVETGAPAIDRRDSPPIASATPPEQPVAAGTTTGTSVPAAPSTDTERQLAETWGRLLGIAGIRRDDNFFDLGGHSLLVMQAVGTMELLLKRRIDPRRYIFESLAQIAAGYDEAPVLPQPRRRLVERLFGGKRT